jgi:hypothetical protein
VSLAGAEDKLAQTAGCAAVAVHLPIPTLRAGR